MADTKQQPDQASGDGADGATADRGPTRPTPPPSPSSRATVRQRIDYLRQEKALAGSAGGPEAIERQHARGKLSARERLDLLLDPGSFVEIDPLARHRVGTYGLDHSARYTDGVVTGWGTDRRPEGVRVQPGLHGLRRLARRGVRREDLQGHGPGRRDVGAPVIGINDSRRRAHPGGRRVARRATATSSTATCAPPASSRRSRVIMGPCAGGAVYSPAITDFVYMVKGTSYMFITGPDVIKAVTGEEVTFEELGGASTHASRSGIAQFIAEDEASCLAQVRYLLSFLPSNNLEDPPAFAPTDDPDRRRRVAERARSRTRRAQPYDMKDVIKTVVDNGEFYEVFPLWAMNILIGFARLDGMSVGVIAQPAEGARRHARLRLQREGRALRPLLRRVQHPARSCSRTSRGSCPERRRSTAASSGAAPSCCTRSARRPCRRSP